MAQKKRNRQLIPLIRESVNNYFANPVILLPFVTIAFIQLLVLEVIYFSPRFPLVKFFGPMISRLEGESFLHYPSNFLILPKWFQLAQYVIYIFISSFFICTAINIISNIESALNVKLGML